MPRRKVTVIDRLELSVREEWVRILTVRVVGSGAPGWSSLEVSPFHRAGPPADGFYELEFLGEPPRSASGGLVEIRGVIELPLAPGMKGVRVHGARNVLSASLIDALAKGWRP